MKRISILAGLLMPFSIFAQGIMDVQRLSQPILLDGLVNEAGWQEIAPLPMTMYTPVFKGEMTETTEIRITYDDQFIYLSGVFYDSEPQGIQGNSLVRDIDKGGDFFNVALDTFNDNENLVTFTTTPAGNRIDAEISNDAEGDFTAYYNIDWNAYWDTRVVVENWGWSAETRIPFSSIKFELADEDAVLGLIVHRLIGRKNERHTFPAIEPKWEMAPWKASQAQKVRFRGIKKRKPVYFTPYLLGGYEEQGALISEEGKTKSLKKEAGFDLKYGLTNNLNLDVTVNTDFAQVEVDDQQVNLTRFSLFFPEKRQFFMERSGIFSFGLGGQDRLFYSRRIGISPQGDPLRMYGGVRLTGRINNLDIGVLNTQVAENTINPSENFGVIRLRQRVFNAYSFIGTMITSRLSEDGQSNISYGIDGVIRIEPQLYLTLRMGQTLDSEQQSSLSENAFLFALLDKRAIGGLGYQVELRRFGTDFNPGIGFNLRNNVTAMRPKVWHGFFTDDNPWLRIITPWIESTSFHENGTGSIQTHTVVSGVKFDLKSGTVFSLSGQRTLDRPTGPFRLSEEIIIESGQYEFYSLLGSYSTTQGRRVGVNLSLENGQFYGGRRSSFGVSPRWTVSKHLDLVTDLIYNRVNFPESTSSFKGNIGRVRVNFAVNNHLSMNAFIQFNQADQTMGMNWRLRYNFREGTDLFIVYNQGNSTADLTEMPGLINRSLLVKYTYSFVKN